MTGTEDCHALLDLPLDTLMARARTIRDTRGPARMTYSPKVFIPLTRLCADVCHYCTFATTPSALPAAYLDEDEVLAIARAGQAAGCTEALFTLGDAPERRYRAAREWLAARGFARTIDYVRHCAERVLRETGLLPHVNAGVLEEADYRMLRSVAASCGLMLESTSEALCAPGGPHHGSPDKLPQVRLASLAAAGRAGMAMTSGLLSGIGETVRERVDALMALRDLHRAHGHLQEVIVQNFCPTPGTRMAHMPGVDEETMLRTIAMARVILPPDVSVQVPPNLNDARIARLIDAGMDDWGGISPVTPDHVNPEKRWPEVERLGAICAGKGLPLAPRLILHPRFVTDAQGGWIDPALRPAVLRLADAQGLAREGQWCPGSTLPVPGTPGAPLGAIHAGPVATTLHRLIERAASGTTLSETEVATLFDAREGGAMAVVEAADALRRAVRGDEVTYVINRNINYTNICTHACGFCAFSKSSSKAGLRDKPYRLDLDEIAHRAREAWNRGATEVCLQGGIHPEFTGETYLAILRTIKGACPDLHIHAFSPLEVTQGARRLGLPLGEYLAMLKGEGLGSLPGTAAEILDDDVRQVICPDKLTTREWLDVVGAAHRIGLPTTSTIMFGHVEQPIHWARHLLRLREQQQDTGGFTEFVPLPYVHMEAPMFRRGQSRGGPGWRESVLMHAVARLVLHGWIGSIQCSWVKLGWDGAAAMLGAGVNDLGGVLMNESISRAAGAAHGQEITPADLAAIAATGGRTLVRRDTLYRRLAPPGETMAQMAPA